MSERNTDPLPDRNPEPGIHARFAKAFSEVGAISKGSYNEHHQYAYRSIDDVMSAVHDVLSRNGLFYLPRLVRADTEWSKTAHDKPIQFVQATYCFDFWDEDGMVLTCGPVIAQAADTDDKAPMKALSQAAKSALLQAFCVPVGEDADAQSPVTQGQAQQGQSRPQPQQAQSQGQQPAQGQSNEASKKQVGLILHSLSEMGLEDRHITNLLAAQYGQNVTRVSSLTRKQASGLIDWISEYPDKVKEWAGLTDSGNGRYAKDVEDVPLPEEPPQDAPI